MGTEQKLIEAEKGRISRLPAEEEVVSEVPVNDRRPARSPGPRLNVELPGELAGVEVFNVRLLDDGDD